MVECALAPSQTALTLAKRLGVDVIDRAPNDQLYLQPGPPALQLCQPTRPRCSIQVDFVQGRQAHRRRQLGHQHEAIAKACGLGQTTHPHIVDATAGLGRDAFILAALGAQVTLIERSPVLCAMLDDGLERARHAGLDATLERMQLIEHDAITYLQSMRRTEVEVVDVVYLDPMYTGSRRAAASKELALLHTLLGPGDDAPALLDAALAAARRRVVVKRQRRAPPIANHPPHHQLMGRSTRFDIYTINPATSGDSAE